MKKKVRKYGTLLVLASFILVSLTFFAPQLVDDAIAFMTASPSGTMVALKNTCHRVDNHCEGGCDNEDESCQRVSSTACRCL